MTKAKIEQLLREQFQPSYLNVIDDSHKHAGHAGAKQGGHFSVEIEAEVFKGKKLLESHRLIYAALEPIKGEMHALAIKIKGGKRVDPFFGSDAANKKSVDKTMDELRGDRFRAL